VEPSLKSAPTTNSLRRQHRGRRAVGAVDQAQAVASGGAIGSA
jgi:hypothetical protein